MPLPQASVRLSEMPSEFLQNVIMQPTRKINIKDELTKPQQQTLLYYNYFDCRDYIQKKYKFYSEQDYADSYLYNDKIASEINKKYGIHTWRYKDTSSMTDTEFLARNEFQKLMENKPPILNFYQWVLDTYKPKNFDFIFFNKTKLVTIDIPWIKQIYSHYINEFANENGRLCLYISW